MIDILYAESDFKLLMEGRYFYQDRTDFIEKLEKWQSKYPRFFCALVGSEKSLFY
ncbi:MAG: hypothetical protein HC817_14160 [Saprospiraceae bacterium]|nr:hypothetical protein [Saprospiraceae bacterium]